MRVTASGIKFHIIKEPCSQISDESKYQESNSKPTTYGPALIKFQIYIINYYYIINYEPLRDQISFKSPLQTLRNKLLILCRINGISFCILTIPPLSNGHNLFCNDESSADTNLQGVIRHCIRHMYNSHMILLLSSTSVTSYSSNPP